MVLELPKHCVRLLDLFDKGKMTMKDTQGSVSGDGSKVTGRYACRK